MKFKKSRIGIVVFIGSLIALATGCQQVSDSVDKGKQLAADNIELSCVNGADKAPMSVGQFDKNAFSGSVMMKLVLKRDFSKTAILEAVQESATNHPVICTGKGDYTSLQISIKEGKDGLTQSALKAYADHMKFTLPMEVAKISKKGSGPESGSYVIEGIKTADPTIPTEPKVKPPIQPSPSAGTQVNQNIDKN